MRNKSDSYHWFAIALGLAGAFSLLERFRTLTFINYYDDDAFYYFQIARNIVSHRGSTFDGVHLTNGYHPLWMFTLVVLSLISTGKAFFILLQCVAILSFITTFIAARGIFRCVSRNLALTQVAATIIALQCLLLIRGGMEVTLTIPLVLLLCWYRLRPQFQWTPSSAMYYGLLSALTILSRLDSALLISLLLIFEVVISRPSSSRDWRLRIYAAISVALPVSVYLLSNHHWFHTWTPISGVAKQLRTHHSFNFASIVASLSPINFPYRVIIVYPASAAFIVSVVILAGLKYSAAHRSALIVSLSFLLFPFLQFFVFWSLSDWPIWPWYLYSLLLLTTAGALFFFANYSESQIPIRQDARMLLQGSILIFACLFAALNTIGTQPRRWYLIAKDVEAFSKTHTGIYAMGDDAGTTGYLINQPLIQTEGLVMDTSFLQNIREQRNLNLVLQDYKVSYYITTDAEFVRGCYKVREPIQAGPDSPHMQGQFCDLPIATYLHGDTTVNIFDAH